MTVPPDAEGSPPPILTIAIPTFNRRDALCSVLQAMVAAGTNRLPRLEILVVDDDSPDQTFDALRDFVGMPGLTILKNEQRLGFQENFLNVIARAHGEYVLFSTDDDFIVHEGIVALLADLQAQSSPAGLISTAFYRDGTIYRGHASAVQDIPLKEYRNCCSHLPGVAMNRRLALACAQRVRPFVVDRRNVTPQCCLSFLILLFGYPARYVPYETVRTGYDLQSGLHGYSTIQGRWQLFLFYSDFFQHLIGSTQDKTVLFKLFMQWEMHKRSLFRLIGAGINEERPEYIAYYIQGAEDYMTLVPRDESDPIAS